MERFDFHGIFVHCFEKKIPNYIKLNLVLKNYKICDILLVHNRYNIPRPIPPLLFCIE